MTPSLSVFEAIWARKVPFLIAFFLIFTVSYGLLALVDWLPESPIDTEDVVEEVMVPPVAPELPIALSIAVLDRAVPVLNPTSAEVAVLDAALLEGVVRHPGSAKLGEDGNVLILGHSSYLPTVFNKNYQAFNGINTLKWGDEISVTSGDFRYAYRVTKVYEAKASAVTVPTSGVGKRLTLVTCDNFGAKEDRFIIEAEFVARVALTAEPAQS